MVKVFESAPRDDGYGEYPNTTPLPFVLPGDLYVYTGTPPKPAVWNRTQLASRGFASDDRKIASLIDFLAGTLKNPADRQRLEDRLLDASDSLDLIDLMPVITWLSQTWRLQMEGKQVPAGDLSSTPDSVPDVMPAAAPGEAVFEQPGEAMAAPVTGELAVQPALPPVPPA